MNPIIESLPLSSNQKNPCKKKRAYIESHLFLQARPNWLSIENKKAAAMANEWIMSSNTSQRLE